MPVGTAVDLILGSMLDRRNRLDPTSKTPNFQRATVTEPRGPPLAMPPKRARGYQLCSISNAADLSRSVS